MEPASKSERLNGFIEAVLKALTVIGMAGSMFWYYLGFLKRGAADGEA